MTSHKLIYQMTVAFAFLAMLISSPLASQDSSEDNSQVSEVSDEVKEAIDTLMLESQERLALSDEQSEKIRPVLKMNAEKRLAILKKFGITPDNPGAFESLGFRSKLKIRGEMDSLRKHSEKQMEEILTADQMKEWKEMAEERRKKMREQMTK